MASSVFESGSSPTQCRWAHRRWVLRAGVFAALALGVCAARSDAQHILAATNPTNPPAAEAVRPAAKAIVIGFMGGMVKRDAPDRSEVKLAAKLREQFADAAFVDTYKNANWKDAETKILSLLDTDKDGTVSEDEKKQARIILFGHSWGASATVTLARDLRKMGIPVLLTVQVDSVQKMGQKDDVIPSNVQEAINFYQPDGFLHGRSVIRAEDPAKTKILGNQLLSYKHTSLSCKGYPWRQRVFAKEHMYIECDPEVWSQIETLIRSRLPQTQAEANSNSSNPVGN